ncbi:MAG: NifB/NifX family molybdenum-iron cluster-binding protein [Proteocatella sp.]
MKIATTYENGNIFQHFGHSENFKVYEIEDGKIMSSKIVPTEGSGHGALSGFLASQGVEILICGGIGGGAKTALAEAGIKLYGGVNGDSDAAVEQHLAGKLEYNPNTQCTNHGDGHNHEHGHDCGSQGHSCGSH